MCLRRQDSAILVAMKASSMIPRLVRHLAVGLLSASVMECAAAHRWNVVADGGADGTGATDSTASIQRCIDAAARAGGGTVYMPPGLYRIGSLSIGANVRLGLAGGARDAREGYTDAVRDATLNPKVSAIVRTIPDRKVRHIFMYNLVPPAYCTNGVGDITISGGVFDCEGKMLVLAFACGRNIRLENMVVKDLPNNHAFQIDGCSDVIVTNCLFAGYKMGGILTRETIQVEQTSPGAIVGNPKKWASPIICNPEDAFYNRNVTVAGCWFGASENLGPQLIPVGHHGRPPSCVGFSFTGNVVVDPLYAALRLPDFTDITIADNTFIATNRVQHLAKDEAIICLFGNRPKGPGSPTVTLRGNRYVLDPSAPRRKLFVSDPRKCDVRDESGDEGR